MAKIKEGAVVTLKSQPEHKMTVQSMGPENKVTAIWIHNGDVKKAEFEKHVLKVEDKNKDD